MLVDIVTAITGPFGFCTGKPVQVEQMTAIIGRIRFYQWQAKSDLTQLAQSSLTNCAARLALTLAQ